MGITKNKTAKKYHVLQNSINWFTASNSEQLHVMLKMRELLTDAHCAIPIFDNGHINLITGHKLIINSSDCLDSLNRRIIRLKNVST